ncbi:MAG: Pr6Pr family membrane protein [bacterium]
MTRPERAYIMTGTIIGWTALLLQFYVSITVLMQVGSSFFGAAIKYLSYFTILTNLLVTLCLSFLWLKPCSMPGIFFSRPLVKTALAVYILIVGIIYSAMLRHQWNPQGIGLVADELLHDVMPLLFLFYWITFVPKNSFKWTDAFKFLVYPLVYIVYSVIRGGITGDYPYWFANVGVLGIQTVFMYTIFILVAFVFVGLIFILIGKVVSRD